MTLAQPPLRSPVRFTPEQYFYLSEQNMLGEGRTELIHGKIVRMSPQLDLHAYGVTELADFLRGAFPKKQFWVRVQMTLHCGDSVPEPDVAVIDGPSQASRTVMTGDRALFVAEVADSTLLSDTRAKPAIYAEAGVPDYWVLDMRNRRMIIHRSPERVRGRWRYADVKTHEVTATIAPLSASRRKVRVGTFLP